MYLFLNDNQTIGEKALLLEATFPIESTSITITILAMQPLFEMRFAMELEYSSHRIRAQRDIDEIKQKIIR